MSSVQQLAANPLYTFEQLPPFDQIRAEHVEPAVRARLAEYAAALEEWESNVEPTWESVIEKSLDLGEPLERVWGVTRHLLSVRNSPELREAHAALEPEVVTFGLRVAQSRPLYEATLHLRQRADELGLDPVQKRILDLRILRAQLDGIGLDPEARERFNAIVQQLSAIQTEFSNNVLDATRSWGLDLTDQADVAGLPDSVRAMFAQSWARTEGSDAVADAAAGPWRLTLDLPALKAFMEYSERRDLREKLMRASAARCVGDVHDNTGKLVEILKLRREMAHLLGFANYAEVSLASKMANLDDVRRLLEDLRIASRPRGEREFEELQAFAASHGAPALEPWDLAYWRRRLRESRFDLDVDALRQYFPLDRVLSGLFGLIERLFSARIEEGVDNEPVWHPDVKYYRVLDATSGEPIAGFYLDAYSRPADKRGGAWMSECIGRRMTGGRRRLPVAYLICNGAPPVAGKPSLLSFDEVETLFHEFGHGLQHMLTHIDHAEVAGIGGVEWDAVELPSQFMENWVYHAPVMRSLSKHVDTGEALPEVMLEKLRDARNFEAATMMLRQLTFGLSDIALHADFDPEGGITPRDFVAPVVARTAVAPQLPGDNFLATFSHIFAGGYAAGYYSYKWAEVLSADAFAAFEEVGLDDDDAVVVTGRRFRDTVLGLGGSLHPSEVYEKFRGRQATIDALLRHNGLIDAAE